MAEIEVTRNDDEQRYEARVGDRLAGAAYYERDDELVVFTHTEVEEEFEGRGVGSALARAALDDVRTEGRRRVVPRCPFIAGWIQRHPDCQALVDADV